MLLIKLLFRQSGDKIKGDDELHSDEPELERKIRKKNRDAAVCQMVFCIYVEYLAEALKRWRLFPCKFMCVGGECVYLVALLMIIPAVDAVCLIILGSCFSFYCCSRKKKKLSQSQPTFIFYSYLIFSDSTGKSLKL